MVRTVNKLSKSQKSLQPKSQQRISAFFARREVTATAPSVTQSKGDITVGTSAQRPVPLMDITGATSAQRPVPLIDVTGATSAQRPVPLIDTTGDDKETNVLAGAQSAVQDGFILSRSPCKHPAKENALTGLADEVEMVGLRPVGAATRAPLLVSPLQKRPAIHGECISPGEKRPALSRIQKQPTILPETKSTPSLAGAPVNTPDIIKVPAVDPSVATNHLVTTAEEDEENVENILHTPDEEAAKWCAEAKSAEGSAVRCAGAEATTADIRPPQQPPVPGTPQKQADQNAAPFPPGTPRTPQKQSNLSCEPMLDWLDDISLSPFKEEAAAGRRAQAAGCVETPGWRRFSRYSVAADESLPDGSRSLSLQAADMSQPVRRVTLRGSWCHTRIQPGDIVHVLSTGPGDVIDNNAGQLVVHPDRLISGTAVVAATFCRRKAVLSELFRSAEPPSKVMLVGTLVHALFQRVMRDQLRSLADVEAALTEQLQDPAVVAQAYGGGIAVAELEQEARQFIAPTLGWVRQYTEWGRDAELVPRAGESANPADAWDGRVTALRDIEENFWSPRLGVKGKIDLTVEIGSGRQAAVLPLELKTGRASFSAEHQGQVTLYAMMAGERRAAPGAGLLVYLRTGATRQFACGPHQQRDLIQLRNDVTDHLARPPSEHTITQPLPLPEGISNERACQKCPLLVACAALRRPDERPHAVPSAAGHLAPAHLDYFLRWSALVRLETASSAARGSQSRLWTEPAAVRQGRGLCLAGCRLLAVEQKGAASWLHRLQLPASVGSSEPGQLSVGELVLVSTDADLALALGPLTSLTGTEAHLLLPRALSDSPSLRYHLDRYEYGGETSAGTYLCSLARLMEDSDRARRLRQLMIEGVQPDFVSGLGRAVVVQCRAILKPLNKLQQRAMLRALMAEDYLLIQGLPGTGKTSTVVALVRMLVARGRSVLLASYTHSAVDTILLKLSQTFTDFVRLGRAERVHRDLQRFCSENLTTGMTNPEQLEAFYASKQVFATTCLGVGHPVFQRRRFDICIIDEASQTVQPAALGPILLADRFILVGDPQQLPPVIQSAAARRHGMDRCLFSRLATEHNTVQLTVQYRMNRTLTAAANHLAYEGRLSCGTDAVAYATLPELPPQPDEPAWLSAALDPSLERALLLLNTDSAATSTADRQGDVANPAEASIVVAIVQSLVGRGIAAADVGVIAPFRGQVRLLRRYLPSPVEVSTVDQYQGRDKSVIIYSCTRTSHRAVPGASSGDGVGILSDLRRLTVAVTRAKHKLVMVGSRLALLTYPPFCKLLSHLCEEDVVSVPADGVNPLPALGC